MTIIQAIIIAIIEGLTEFLPISSTAHMRFANPFLGLESSPFVNMFEVVIQLAAILAVVVLYWRKFFDFKRFSFYIKLIIAVLPALKKKYLKYESYRNQTIEDMFPKEELDNATKLEAYTMQSTVFINNKNGTFTAKPLPTTAQLSSMYAIAAEDFDGDKNIDILMAGNFYESKPEVGIYDASYGTLMKGDGKGNFTSIPAQQSGINIKGAVRDMATINVGKKKIILIAMNNEAVKILSIK